MSYIEDLRTDYMTAIKQWRRRHLELSDEEWVEAVDITMAKGGKKTFDKEPDIYEKEILERISNQYPVTSRRFSVILDAGCGYGFLLYQLHLLGFKTLVGIDLSKTCVNICRERFDNFNIVSSIWIRNIYGLLSDDNFFDLITCTEVLEHDKNPLNIINEIYRILKSGGVVYFSTPYLNRRHAWNHINYFYMNQLLETNNDLSEYNKIDIVELFKASLFENYNIQLIGRDRFCLVEARKG